jgi:hypothetical protein
MFDTVILYEQLYRDRTRLMTLFLIRFALLHPDVSKFERPSKSGFDKAALAKLNNKGFYDAFFRVLNGMGEN